MAEAMAPRVEGEEERTTLVARARSGDRAAAEAVLRAVELPVWRTCRALLPPHEDVEGAVQDVLVKVLKKLGSYRGEGELAAWAALVAANHCRDLLRRRRLVPFVALETGEEERNDPAAVLPSPEPDPERALRARQGIQRLKRGLRELPARQQQVFSLRFFAHMSLAGIAAALGVDEGTVKTHLHRALARVREQVKEAWP